MDHACCEWMAGHWSIRSKRISCLIYQFKSIGVCSVRPLHSTTLCSTCKTLTTQGTECFLLQEGTSKTGTTATVSNLTSVLMKSTILWSHQCLRISQNHKLKMYAKDSFTQVTPFPSMVNTPTWMESITTCSLPRRFLSHSKLQDQPLLLMVRKGMFHSQVK